MKILVVVVVVYLAFAAYILVTTLRDSTIQATDKPVESGGTKGQEEAAVPGLYKSDSNGELKLEIVAGVTEVPVELNLTRETIIKEYIYDCHMLNDRTEGLTCITYYYANNDKEFTEGISNCETLSAADTRKCLDEFYFSMAETRSDLFCQMVTGQEMREKCGGIR